MVRVLEIDRILLKDKGGVDSGTMCARWTTKGTAGEVRLIIVSGGSNECPILPIGIVMQYRIPSLGVGFTIKVFADDQYAGVGLSRLQSWGGSLTALSQVRIRVYLRYQGMTNETIGEYQNDEEKN
ncbi:hypothetical protein AgCh_028114 [Apium graveolens]